MEGQHQSRLHEKLRAYAIRIGDRTSLLDLPVELRLEIYEWVLRSTTAQTSNALAILRVNRQVHSEFLDIAFPYIRFRFSCIDSLQRFVNNLPADRLPKLQHVRLIARCFRDLVTLPLRVDEISPTLHLKSLNLFYTSTEPLIRDEPSILDNVDRPLPRFDRVLFEGERLRMALPNCFTNMRTNWLKIVHMAYTDDNRAYLGFAHRFVRSTEEAWSPECDWDYEFSVFRHRGYKRLVVYVGNRTEIHHARVGVSSRISWDMFETLVFGRDVANVS